MNIFYLDRDYNTAASYHCDKHVVKMIVETGQLLSNAHHLIGSLYCDEFYRPTHLKHPCSKWVIQSQANYDWLLNLGFALVNEYKKRYGKKRHKTERILNLALQYKPQLRTIGFTRVALAMPEQYRQLDTVQAYRAYYCGEKIWAKWKLGNIPDWFKPKVKVSKVTTEDTDDLEILKDDYQIYAQLEYIEVV